MIKLQLLAIQIQTDMQELLSDIDNRTITNGVMIEELKRMNLKLKEWSIEANKIMDEFEKANSTVCVS